MKKYLPSTGEIIVGTMLGLATVLMLVLWFAPPSHAASASRGDFTGPHGWPVKQIEPATKEVKTLRTTYVERINSRASYVEFNNGATQYIRNCHGAMTLCVNPRSGTVRMEDGSRVYLARRGVTG